MLRVFWILALVVAGCGSAQQGPCALRSGTFRVDAVERTGTCGPLTEQITTETQDSVSCHQPPAPCTSGGIQDSPDNCEVTTVNVVCPEDGIGPGATSTTNGKAYWNDAGSQGTGQATIVIRDAGGAILCQSSYDVTTTKL
jgi:hypothetical protein